MKFMLLLMATAGSLAVAVPDSGESQPTKTVSMSVRPAPPPINGPVNVSAPGPHTPTRTLSSDFTITTETCLPPSDYGAADLGDCAALCNFFEEEADATFTLDPLEILAWSSHNCVFEILNRDTCGTYTGNNGQIVTFCNAMLTECISRGEDGLINLEQPPLLMIMGGDESLPPYSPPPYTADANCNDAHDEI
ncbi:hypothetical protein DFH07DRAFT_766356 [Mycena maculata]|uniref:Uncharacterized protein n=1 Tax=Mycena maculata TaxID=230809 RepID=A0AAD7K3M8_9AGAR|nr:hypothetical protein DFH07DRAFT_766356 [Mycena maculata]